TYQLLTQATNHRSNVSATRASVARRLTAGRHGGVGRLDEVKDAAAGGVRRGPQAAVVSLDDRARDREAHPHSVAFGREERSEDAVDVLRGDAGPRVLHRYQHPARGVDRGPPAERSCPVRA